MANWRAKAQLYVEDRLIEPDEKFSSDLVPGKNWEPLDEPARKAFSERFPSGAPVDPKPAGSGHTMVAIPDDWRDLPTPQIIALAVKLGAPRKGTGRDHAVLHIDREMAARSMVSRERQRDAA